MFIKNDKKKYKTEYIVSECTIAYIASVAIKFAEHVVALRRA